MAQDIGYDWTAGATAADILAGDLTDTNFGAKSAAIDLGNPSPVQSSVEVKLVCSTSADGLCYLHVYWSNDDTDYAGDNGDNGDNSDVFPIQCKASVTIVAIVTIPTRARYLKIQLENQSGGTITDSGSVATFTDVFFDVA